MMPSGFMSYTALNGPMMDKEGDPGLMIPFVNIIKIKIMKRLSIFLISSIVCIHAARSQGCVAIHNLAGFGQFASLGYAESTQKWMLNINNRYFDAWTFLDGKKNITPAKRDDGLDIYEVYAEL